MTRQYFSDQRNLHSQNDDMNVVEHPRASERDRSSSYDDYRENLLEKANSIITNRKVLTYLSSALALGLIVGTASIVTSRLRRRKSTMRLINKWISDKF